MPTIETCDRCGEYVAATTWFWRPEGKAELTFCGHHANEYAKALNDQRFLLACDARPTRELAWA